MRARRPSAPETGFALPERYRVVRELGQGGMGVVYEVEDQARGERVALKSLKRPGSDLLYRLKREFRELSDLQHPNLIRLHELVVDGQDCFFTMELVEGDDFLGDLRARPARATDSESAHAATLEATPSAPVTTGTVASRVTGPVVDQARLRAHLVQLATGLDALHAAGKIHRDVKPSNILVASDGRVVLVDFGLVAAAEAHETLESMSGGLVGTVAYMAPEQCRGEVRLLPAADWYAVGTILYEALTGRLPFDGAITKVLVDKQTLDPPRPRAVRPDVPADLDALCMRLLAREPEMRPGAAEVLAALRGEVSAPIRAPRRVSLAGRMDELARLEPAIATLGKGGTAAILIDGPSGIGKSALVRAFVDRARAATPSLVVLQGRCYERESVPFQALDSLIDHLSTTWRALPVAEAAELLPLDAALLPRLFPVLERVPAVAAAPQGRAVADPQELRRRGFAALREVFVRLGRRRPLILVLDDLQWGDAGTRALLADLLGPPDPPAMVLILSARPEGRAALESLARGLDASFHHVALSPLSLADSTDLAQRLLGDDAAPSLAARVAQDAAGSPFFIGELVELWRSAPADLAGEIRLEDVLARRIAGLPVGAVALLELVALAGEPLAPQVLRRAAGVDAAALRRDVDVLTAARFLRTTSSDAGEGTRLEPYHDRVRDAVIQRLSPESRRLRAHALATALEQTSAGTDEQLAALWRAAGEPSRAAPRARQAADRALGRLDFARAAALYGVALDVGGWSPAEHAELLAARGGALLDAGESREAADVLSAAAAKAEPRTALDLSRRAAEALVRGGYFEEGMRTLRRVLREFGSPVPRTFFGAIARLVWRRLRLAVRGLGYQERAEADVPPRALMKIDALWTTASCLITTDFLRAADFQALHLRLALDAGEPLRVARALVMEGVQLKVRGSQARGEAVLVRLRQLLDRVQLPYVEAMYNIGQAILLLQIDNAWRRALAQLRVAEEHYRRVTTAGYELAGCRTSVTQCLYFLGELAELAQVVPAFLRDADRRADRHTAGMLRLRLPVVHLMRDDVDAAERDVDRSLLDWPPPEGSYLLPQYYALLGRVEIALYKDDPEAAAALLARDAKDLGRSMLERISLVRANMLFLRGRVAVALVARARAAGDAAKMARHGALAERAARDLAALAAPVGAAWGAVVAGGLAAARGDAATAVPELRRAVAALERLEMRFFSESARHLLGRTMGGRDGDALVAEATAWFESQGVAKPARLAAINAPGDHT